MDSVVASLDTTRVSSHSRSGGLASPVLFPNLLPNLVPGRPSRELQLSSDSRPRLGVKKSLFSHAKGFIYVLDFCRNGRRSCNAQQGGPWLMQ